jgi:hypothetical protein
MLLLCYCPLSFCYLSTPVPVSWLAQLARIGCMALLLSADADGQWPVEAAAFSVIPSCCGIVVEKSPCAGGAHVVLIGRMESLQQTVATHVVWLGVLDHFTSGSSFVLAATAAAVATAAATVWHIFLVGYCFGELGNQVRHGLDFCSHCIHHRLCAVVNVGGLLFLGAPCLGNPGNVLPQFAVTINLCCLICTFKVVLAGRAATVLLLDFVVPDKPFKVGHYFVEIVLDGFGLVFPLCHLFLVKVVQGIHLLEIKLEFVLVRDCDAVPFDAHLFVIGALAKGCEMLFSVPICVTVHT